MKPLREARSESCHMILDSQILPICLCACFDTLCNSLESRSNGFVFKSCESKESLAVNHKKSPFTTKEMDKQQMGQRLRTMRQELTSQPQQSALFRHAIGFPCFFLQLLTNWTGNCAFAIRQMSYILCNMSYLLSK